MMAKISQELKATEVELLRVENLTLKLAAIQADADKQAAPIIAAREELGRAIGQRLGIDMSLHSIDLNTGAITPMSVKPGELAAANQGKPAR